jgi:hypothetical protein
LCVTQDIYSNLTTSRFYLPIPTYQCLLSCPADPISKLGSSPFSYGPSVRVRAGCRDEMVDVACVHEIRRCLLQRRNANVSHRRFQFILHDWLAQLDSNSLSRHALIFTYYQSNAPLLLGRSSLRIACFVPCLRLLPPSRRL